MTVNDLKRAVISTQVFKLGGGFLMEAQCNAEDAIPTYEAYIWHKDYGIKELLFGTPAKDWEAFLDEALYLADDLKSYYAEKYMY